jgi:exosome complex exonuclease DIS3/RRP44
MNAHRETAVVREEDESPNDRNDRSIRLAASWYASHLAQARASRGASASAGPAPQVVLLTDDAANRAKAEEKGMPCASVRKYVEAMKDAAPLLDLIAAAGGEEVEAGREGSRKALYPEVSCKFVLVR